jgi:hypothetical protein
MRRIVRPIPLAEAARIVVIYEPMAPMITHAFGLFLAGALASVVCFGPPHGANIRPQPDVIVLKRGASAP